MFGERPLIIAHRGARSLAPENTLAAARKALEVGADMWELDVGMTADRQLVLMHDDTLERTTDARTRYPERDPWRLRDFTLDEVQRLDGGSWFDEDDPFDQIAAGAVSASERAHYHGEPVPTLREALHFTREHHWRVMVEIKVEEDNGDTDTLVREVVREIEDAGLVEQAVVASFNAALVQAVRECNPALTTLYLTKVPVDDPVRRLEELGARIFGPRVDLVRAEDVAALRAAHMGTFVWTVNDLPTAARLAAMGVSGIITDFPQTLKQVVLAHAH